MKKKLNQGIIPLLILTLVAAVCTGLLALTNQITSGPREAQKAKAILASQQKLFPTGQRFEAMERSPAIPAAVFSVEEVFDTDDSPLGFLIKAESKGYAGPVPVYVAYNLTGEIIGVDLPSNTETAGLGQKVREPFFYEQFLEQEAAPVFSLQPKADEIKIDAISGATISSVAVIHGINMATEASTATLALRQSMEAGDAAPDFTYYEQQQVFPKGKRFEALASTPAFSKSIQQIFEVYDAKDVFLGHFISAANKGYNGPVPVHLAFGPQGQILALNIPGNDETAGIGQKVSEDSFKEQFIGHPAKIRFTMNPAEDGEVQVDAISGATISSAAVMQGINHASQANALLTAQHEASEAGESVPSSLYLDQEKVFPQGKRFEAVLVSDEFPKAVKRIEKAFDEKDHFLGFFIEAATKGYNDLVPTHIAYDPTGIILAVNVPENDETPGLGEKVRDAGFAEQFVGKEASVRFTVHPPEEGELAIDAITGATGSCHSVVQAINAASEAYHLLSIRLQRQLIPEGRRFDSLAITDRFPKAIKRIDRAYDAKDQFIGYFIVAATKGYNDLIPSYIAYNTEGVITGIHIPENDETPGLGEKVRDEAFLKQFIGEDAKARFTVHPPEEGEMEIDAITGATGSCHSVVKAVNAASEAYAILAKEGH